MKKLFLVLGLTFLTSAFAENITSIFPRVYNFGRSVQVEVWNHTDLDVRCSGPVYMQLQTGRTEVEYFFDTVPARLTSFRTLYPRSFNERVVSVYHNIFCY